MTPLTALCLMVVGPCLAVEIVFYYLQRAGYLDAEPLFICHRCGMPKRRHQTLPSNKGVCKLCAMDGFVWRAGDD